MEGSSINIQELYKKFQYPLCQKGEDHQDEQLSLLHCIYDKKSSEIQDFQLKCPICVSQDNNNQEKQNNNEELKKMLSLKFSLKSLGDQLQFYSEKDNDQQIQQTLECLQKSAKEFKILYQKIEKIEQDLLQSLKQFGQELRPTINDYQIQLENILQSFQNPSEFRKNLNNIQQKCFYNQDQKQIQWDFLQVPNKQQNVLDQIQIIDAKLGLSIKNISKQVQKCSTITENMVKYKQNDLLLDNQHLGLIQFQNFLFSSQTTFSDNIYTAEQGGKIATCVQGSGCLAFLQPNFIEDEIEKEYLFGIKLQETKGCAVGFGFGNPTKAQENNYNFKYSYYNLLGHKTFQVWDNDLIFNSTDSTHNYKDGLMKVPDKVNYMFCSIVYDFQQSSGNCTFTFLGNNDADQPEKTQYTFKFNLHSGENLSQYAPVIRLCEIGQSVEIISDFVQIQNLINHPQYQQQQQVIQYDQMDNFAIQYNSALYSD